MNPKYRNILIIAGALALVAAVLLILKWQYDSLARQEAMEKSLVEMRQLKDDIVRAQAQYATRDDIEKFAKSHNTDLSSIQDDLKKLDAQIKGISNVTVVTPGYHGNHLPSTSTQPTGPGPNAVTCPDNSTVPCPDPYGYLKNAQTLALNEPLSNGSSIPFGSTEFRAWEAQPWNLQIFPRKYSLTTVLGEDPDGRHYTYHKFIVTSNGKDYPVTIDKAQFLEEFPKAEWRFSPRFYLGVDAGTYVTPLPGAELVPNLELSFFSYGKTKANPDWSVLNVGLGYASQAKSLAVVISPVNYNIGHHLPLVENLHVGPSVVIGTNGAIGILGGIRVGL